MAGFFALLRRFMLDRRFILRRRKALFLRAEPLLFNLGVKGVTTVLEHDSVGSVHHGWVHREAWWATYPGGMGGIYTGWYTYPGGMGGIYLAQQ